MTPKDTQRKSRHSQQFHRSAKPGMRDLPALPPREWLGAMAGRLGKVDQYDFSGDDLVSAHLYKTWFVRCLFVGADLRQADLKGASFHYCDFSGAKLTGAVLAGSRFWHCDFTHAKVDFDAMASAEFEHCSGLLER